MFTLSVATRLTTLSRDGAELARYTYDMSEQRIVKAVAGEAAIHYHYDGEGRLISETDAASGDTLREYVWLGLTPIASFGADNPAANDNNPEDCTDEIAALEADIADRTTRIERNATRIVELGDLATDKQSRIANNAARITELEALIVDKQNRIAELEALIIAHQERITFLTTRNGELAALITGHETRIAELTTRNTELGALITAHETRVTELTDRNAELTALITGHEERSLFLAERNQVLTTQRETLQAELDALLATGCNDPAARSNVTFLHSDHLGRPKFATNANGDVVWDEGVTTPFGIQITAMAAQTQALMFPGQYQDLETTGAGVTLSHNWHRTYDPALGRYLQSDPIGLAGGLNRYAYVGGKPLGYVDPEGLAGILTIYAKDSGDNKFGHAFISFEPDNDKPENECGCDTFGFWPSNQQQGTVAGLNANFFLDDPANKQFSRISYRLNDQEEAELYKSLTEWSGKRYSILNQQQCTSFSRDILNKHTPDRYYGPIFPGSLKNTLIV